MTFTQTSSKMRILKMYSKKWIVSSTCQLEARPPLLVNPGGGALIAAYQADASLSDGQ